MEKYVTAYSIAKNCFRHSLGKSKVPYDTGALRSLFYCHKIDKNNAIIGLDGTTAIRGRPNYLDALNKGTGPHDIPNAFGEGFWGHKVINGVKVWQPPHRKGTNTWVQTGVEGRFDNKFHPGSTKHKGFIDNAVKDMVSYICSRYNGKVI